MKTDAQRSLDLRVRLPNDGSPLWRLLSPVPTPSLRNERIRNLAYAGALVDSGRISVQVHAQVIQTQTQSKVDAQSNEIDLRLRILNDGGILYQMLVAIPPGAGRIGRLKTLANIGAMFEIGPTMNAVELQQRRKQEASAANADQFVHHESNPSRLLGVRQ